MNSTALPAFPVLEPLPAASRSRFPLLELLIYFALEAFVGFVDWWTGYDVSVTPFYILPVAYATWRRGGSIGMAVCVAAAFAWFLGKWFATDFPSEKVSFGAHTWNTFNRFAIFAIVWMFVLQTRSVIVRQRRMIENDPLTGLSTRQGLIEEVAPLLAAGSEAPGSCALVIIDVDDLRGVNRRLSSARGDAVLRTVARAAWAAAREDDVVCRLGSDEVAIFMPSTTDVQAEAVIAEAQAQLAKDASLARDGITFSWVVASSPRGPLSVDPILQLAEDALAQVSIAGSRSVTIRRTLNT